MLKKELCNKCNHERNDWQSNVLQEHFEALWNFSKQCCCLMLYNSPNFAVTSHYWRISIADKPPDGCPYALEHIMNNQIPNFDDLEPGIYGVESANK